MKKASLVTAIFSIFLLGNINLVRAIEITVTDNGGGSDSEVNVVQDTQTEVVQENSSDITNNVEESANTGKNTASGNTDGDVVIATGDINSQTTVENNLNTNVASTLCCQGETTVKVTGNGAESQNTLNLSQTNNTTIVQNNTAKITNNIVGVANTGNNNADSNTGGDVSIDTGDIKISTSVINGPINISSVKTTTGFSGATVKLAGNGYASVNKVDANFDNNTNIYSNYSADIENYIIWDANTGGNSANKNTNGDVSISTGDIELDTFIKNLVNLGKVEVKCCEVYDPGKPKEPDKPNNPGEEPKTDNERSGGNGKLLPEAAAVEAGGPGIVGLADTSSGGFQSLLFMLGLAFVAIGGKIATDQFLPATSEKE